MATPASTQEKPRLAVEVAELYPPRSDILTLHGPNIHRVHKSVPPRSG
jgi:hypothetical protein